MEIPRAQANCSENSVQCCRGRLSRSCLIASILECRIPGIMWIPPMAFFHSQAFVSYQSNASFNPCTWENRENRECGPDDSWHQMYTLPRLTQCILTMVSWLLGSCSRKNNVIGFTSMILTVETDAGHVKIIKTSRIYVHFSALKKWAEEKPYLNVRVVLQK